MKIALVTSKFIPIVGGGETYIWCLAQQFRKDGSHVTIITDEHVREMGIQEAAFEYIFIPSFIDACTGKTSFVETVTHLYRALMKPDFDIVHVQSIGPLFLINQFSSRLKTKIVFTFHNTPYRSERVMGFYKNFDLDYAFAEHIIKNGRYDLSIQGSRYYWEWAVKLGAEPKKNKLVYLGVDREWLDLFSIFVRERVCPQGSRQIVWAAISTNRRDDETHAKILRYFFSKHRMRKVL